MYEIINVIPFLKQCTMHEHLAYHYTVMKYSLRARKKFRQLDELFYTYALLVEEESEVMKEWYRYEIENDLRSSKRERNYAVRKVYSTVVRKMRLKTQTKRAAAERIYKLIVRFKDMFSQSMNTTNQQVYSLLEILKLSGLQADVQLLGLQKEIKLLEASQRVYVQRYKESQAENPELQTNGENQKLRDDIDKKYGELVDQITRMYENVDMYQLTDKEYEELAAIHILIYTMAKESKRVFLRRRTFERQRIAKATNNNRREL